MTCPRCKDEHDVLQYRRMMTIEEYEHETMPIYKCPKCNFMFAPAGQMDHEVAETLYQQMQETLKEILAKVNS